MAASPPESGVRDAIQQPVSTPKRVLDTLVTDPGDVNVDHKDGVRLGGERQSVDVGRSPIYTIVDNSIKSTFYGSHKQLLDLKVWTIIL